MRGRSGSRRAGQALAPRWSGPDQAAVGDEKRKYGENIDIAPESTLYCV
jgi:hypothetical protein